MVTHWGSLCPRCPEGAASNKAHSSSYLADALHTNESQLCCSGKISCGFAYFTLLFIFIFFISFSPICTRCWVHQCHVRCYKCQVKKHQKLPSFLDWWIDSSIASMCDHEMRVSAPEILIWHLIQWLMIRDLKYDTHLKPCKVLESKFHFFCLEFHLTIRVALTTTVPHWGIPQLPRELEHFCTDQRRVFSGRENKNVFIPSNIQGNSNNRWVMVWRLALG